MRLLELMSGAPAAAMLGMCKNAGKTTAMNRLIREYAQTGGGCLALTSIGRDGEERDLVTGTGKPPIYLYEGMLAATAEKLLPLCDISREILSSTGLYTSLGEVILFRARSDGFVQLAGPGIVAHMKQLRRLFAGQGADCVLIDGALNRLSLLGSAADGVLILSTGASLARRLDEVVSRTAFTAGLLMLPAFQEDDQPSDEALRLPGALTESRARALLTDRKRPPELTVAVQDASRYLLSQESFEALSDRGVRFTVENPAKLAAVTVNPVSAGGWRFDPAEFREKMQAAVSVPVIDAEAAE